MTVSRSSLEAKKDLVVVSRSLSVPVEVLVEPGLRGQLTVRVPDPARTRTVITSGEVDAIDQVGACQDF